MSRRLALLAIGLSPFALAAAQAADTPADKADACSPKVCQRRPADSAT